MDHMDMYVHYLCNSSNYLTDYSTYEKGLPFDPLVILHPQTFKFVLAFQLFDWPYYSRNASCARHSMFSFLFLLDGGITPLLMASAGYPGIHIWQSGLNIKDNATCHEKKAKFATVSYEQPRIMIVIWKANMVCSLSPTILSLHMITNVRTCQWFSFRELVEIMLSWRKITINQYNSIKIIN